ncbi:preprotein translocase subunit SecG [Comamonadaceae bacterium M7527]|nr:preprotein translocase subunit SecG [Comamonadaceae bacterium M7527]
MSVLSNILMAVQLLSALAMIGLILMQHGKGADAGAAFGGGSSGSLFGASGSANFLSRSTAVLAAVFLGTTLFLSYMGYRPPASSGSSALELIAPAVSDIPAPTVEGTKPPAAPVTPDAIPGN